MPNRIDGDFGITQDAVNALLGLIKQSSVGQSVGRAVDDYSQLVAPGSPLNNQYQQLKRNIGQHIPSNDDFQSPEAMSQWSQSAAMNAPMGLATAAGGAGDDIVSLVNKYLQGPEKAKYPGVDPRNYLDDVPIGSGTGSRGDVAVGGPIPNGFNQAIGGRSMPGNMPAQDRNMLSELTYSGNRNRR